ncbi:hypothetical protein ES703_31958 [subsurface metagenome]
MNIVKGETYRIKGKSEFFEKKYGTCNPLFVVEGTDKELFGCFWGGLNKNPTALFYGIRSGLEGLPLGGQVYYGHIEGVAELVHETELEEATE